MEQVDELRREEERTRTMYQAIALVSGLTVIAVCVYALITAVASGAGAVGTSLVDTHFPLPSFAEPVTYLSVASVAFYYSGMQLWQNQVARWSLFRLSVIQLVAIVVAVCSAYEVLYGFTEWGAYLSNQLLASSSGVPWTLVVATKVFFSAFVISGYTVYFLRRIHSIGGYREAA